MRPLEGWLLVNEHELAQGVFWVGACHTYVKFYFIWCLYCLLGLRHSFKHFEWLRKSWLSESSTIKIKKISIVYVQSFLLINTFFQTLLWEGWRVMWGTRMVQSAASWGYAPLSRWGIVQRVSISMGVGSCHSGSAVETNSTQILAAQWGGYWRRCYGARVWGSCVAAAISQRFGVELPRAEHGSCMTYLEGYSLCRWNVLGHRTRVRQCEFGQGHICPATQRTVNWLFNSTILSWFSLQLLDDIFN